MEWLRKAACLIGYKFAPTARRTSRVGSTQKKGVGGRRHVLMHFKCSGTDRCALRSALNCALRSGLIAVRCAVLLMMRFAVA